MSGVKLFLRHKLNIKIFVTIMVKNKYIYGLFLILMSGLLCSCQEESLEGISEDTPNTELQEQTVELYLGSSGESDINGRALPPGLEQNGIAETTCNVNEVALMVFRRKAGSNDEFTFDVGNSAGFDETGKLNGKGNICENFTTETSPLGSTLKKTQGKITKNKAYEYRMFALGYNTARKDEHPSKISTFDEREDFLIVDSKGKGINENTTLSEVKLQLVKRSFKDLDELLYDKNNYGASLTSMKGNITGYWVRTPEIFYGTCQSADAEADDEIIRFQDSNTVSGILMRGVAKVTFNLNNLKGVTSFSTRHCCHLSLFIDKLMTEVHLDSYECFKNPESPLIEGLESDHAENMTFTAVVGEDDCLSEYNTGTVKMSFFVLPTITQVRTRYRTAADFLGHHDKYTYESYIAVPSESNGNQATGVIDPAAGGKTFYFRRNQKYVITGTGTEIAANDSKDGND